MGLTRGSRSECLSWPLLALLLYSTISSASAPLVQKEYGGQAEKRIKLTRVRHAQELLGTHYLHSIVRQTEKIANISPFIRRIVEQRLPKKWKPRSDLIARTILDQALTHGFDPVFLLAMIHTESSFRVGAVGPLGELGLMQLRPDTAQWLAAQNDIPWKGVDSLLDPITNIRLGTLYLATLRKKFAEQTRLYLNAYNMGVGGVRSALKRDALREEYSNRVMKSYLAYYYQLRKLSAYGRS